MNRLPHDNRPGFSRRSLLAVLVMAAAALDGATAATTQSRVFYVDSAQGRDGADGRSTSQAFRTLEQVNSADVQPGDTVRFRCGGCWRGSLLPASGQSGRPVTYTSFGAGPKPLFLGSRPRSAPSDWVKAGSNLWATLPLEYRLGATLLDLRSGQWRRHQEGGADVELKHDQHPDGRVVRLTSRNGGSAGHHVQLWGPTLPVEKGDWVALVFRARSSVPMEFPPVSLRLAGSPWTRLAAVGRPPQRLGKEWSQIVAPMRIDQSSPAVAVHLNLGGMLPKGVVFEFQPERVCKVAPSLVDPLVVDVGNIIFDEGKACGWKKWSVDDLTKPYDYYYDRASERVFLFAEANPATTHRSIELAMAGHVVSQAGAHDVIYDGLAIKYGAAHGFGGGDTHHITIRNCDLAYIGGAHQKTLPDGRPVRFGNAIEFWGAAHDNLVEGCQIWEVYDAALTNQGKSPTSRQVNITYRNNFIRNAEYSFEYWNRPETATTANIRFVNNTCIGAGRGWAHAQRPDPNGSHLMFYTNTAATTGVEIRHNIFYDHTEWGSRYSSGWKVLPQMEGNLWFSRQGVMTNWFGEKIASFDAYRKTTGLDRESIFADPRFVAPRAGDYRLQPDSPARTIRPDGGPVGATSLFQ